MRFVVAALFLAIFNSPSVSAEEKKRNADAAAFQPLPTSAFAQLPFVEKADLSPDGTHMAGLFAIDGAQRIAMMPILGDRSKAVVVGIPDATEVSWIRWVGNDNIVVGLYALQPVQGDRWYISRLIGINRTTGKITKLLWEMSGQNAADLLWAPTDGSTEILVAAQNSIYEGSDFWPAVYRVESTPLPIPMWKIRQSAPADPGCWASGPATANSRFAGSIRRWRSIKRRSTPHRLSRWFISTVGTVI